MAVGDVLLFLLIGAIAGWLAGLLLRGRGFGLIANVLIGVVGAFLARFTFEQMGLALEDTFLATLFAALIGAMALVFLAGLLRRVAGR